MIGLDTNIILNRLVRSLPDHEHVTSWFAQQDEPFGTTDINLGETLRLLTHPRVFPKPLSLNTAIPLVTNFLEHDNVSVLPESESWWNHLLDLAKKVPSLNGNEVFDARIALCLQHNGIKKIATFDADFAKYDFLKRVVI